MDDGTDVDDDQPEVEITFSPRLEVLAELGMTLEVFEEALIEALEEREETAVGPDQDDDEFSALSAMLLYIEGVAYSLGDLAEVEVRAADL